MLTCISIHSVEYLKHLRNNDYEDITLIVPGYYLGDQAQDFNIESFAEVENYLFLSFALNKYKNSTITQRLSKKRIPFYDTTLAMPKTFSIMSLFDDRIKEWHITALLETIKHLQGFIGFKDNEFNSIEYTKTALFAIFTHTVNRYIEPHIHTHIIIFNFTKAKNGKFYAIDSTPIFESLKYCYAIYCNSLALLSKRGGYKINNDKRFPPYIAGVQKYAPIYSERTEIIDQIAETFKNDTGEELTIKQKKTITFLTTNFKSDEFFEAWKNEKEKSYKRLKYHMGYFNNNSLIKFDSKLEKKCQISILPIEDQNFLKQISREAYQSSKVSKPHKFKNYNKNKITTTNKILSNSYWYKSSLLNKLEAQVLESHIKSNCGMILNIDKFKESWSKYYYRRYKIITLDGVYKEKSEYLKEKEILKQVLNKFDNITQRKVNPKHNHKNNLISDISRIPSPIVVLEICRKNIYDSTLDEINQNLSNDEGTIVVERKNISDLDDILRVFNLNYKQLIILDYKKSKLKLITDPLKDIIKHSPIPVIKYESIAKNNILTFVENNINSFFSNLKPKNLFENKIILCNQKEDIETANLKLRDLHSSIISDKRIVTTLVPVLQTKTEKKGLKNYLPGMLLTKHNSLNYTYFVVKEIVHGKGVLAMSPKGRKKTFSIGNLADYNIYWKKQIELGINDQIVFYRGKNNLKFGIIKDFLDDNKILLSDDKVVNTPIIDYGYALPIKLYNFLNCFQAIKFYLSQPFSNKDNRTIKRILYSFNSNTEIEIYSNKSILLKMEEFFSVNKTNSYSKEMNKKHKIALKRITDIENAISFFNSLSQKGLKKNRNRRCDNSINNHLQQSISIEEKAIIDEHLQITNNTGFKI